MDQAFIARPLSLSDKGHLPPDFYSGATGLPAASVTDFCSGDYISLINSAIAIASTIVTPTETAVKIKVFFRDNRNSGSVKMR